MTDDLKQTLEEMAREMKTQDNLCTAEPIYAVQQCRDVAHVALHAMETARKPEELHGEVIDPLYVSGGKMPSAYELIRSILKSSA